MMDYSDLRCQWAFLCQRSTIQDWHYPVQILPHAFPFHVTKIHFCKCVEHILVPLLSVCIISLIQESAITLEMDSIAETGTADHVMSNRL
jgi:hypothetical protein